MFLPVGLIAFTTGFAIPFITYGIEKIKEELK